MTEQPRPPESASFADREFLEALIAACVLTSSADGNISAAELSCVDSVVATDPALAGLDTRGTSRLVEEGIVLLRDDEAGGRRKLSERVMRLFGNEKRARTLMRAVHRIVKADHEIGELERQEFRRLCRLLSLDPEFVWRDNEATSRQARDLGVL